MFFSIAALQQKGKKCLRLRYLPEYVLEGVPIVVSHWSEPMVLQALHVITSQQLGPQKKGVGVTKMGAKPTTLRCFWFMGVWVKPATSPISNLQTFSSHLSDALLKDYPPLSLTGWGPYSAIASRPASANRKSSAQTDWADPQKNRRIVSIHFLYEKRVVIWCCEQCCFDPKNIVLSRYRCYFMCLHLPCILDTREVTRMERWISWNPDQGWRLLACQERLPVEDCLGSWRVNSSTTKPCPWHALFGNG